MEPITMDLGDFVPEQYALRYSINGTTYRFEFGEATVEEMLEIMIRNEKYDGKGQRMAALEFLSNHIVEGDKEKLAKDFATLPYKSKRGGLDVATIFEAINGRVKKNESGEGKSQTTEAPSGSRETSPS